MLNDFDRHDEWMKNMEESRVLKRNSDIHMITYNIFNSPWPFWDRDTPIEINVDYRGPNTEVFLHLTQADPIYMPIQEGINNFCKFAFS